MNENIAFPIGGGVAGASIYSAGGGIGMIGGFGGIGLGLTGMTAIGTVVGSAIFVIAEGIDNQDSNAFAALGFGALGGLGTSATIGGIGVSFGGIVFGLGMGSMAAIGGVFGLGMYGLARMFISSSYSEPIAQTFNRMEEKIAYEEAYYQAMIELSPTLAELSWKSKFAELELEEELSELKKQIISKEKLKLK